jgi:hypothetical protein
MNKIIILIIGCVFSISVFGQTIDYSPKQLYNDILKQHESCTENDISINEIDLSDTKFVEEGKFYHVVNTTSNKLMNHLYIGRINSCRAGGCSIDRPLDPGETSEYFDYYILFDKDCKIKQVRVYNYQASHGQEVTAKNWLKQFIGFDDTSSLKVGKNIDAISGATISVYAITNDIKDKTMLMKKLMETDRVAELERVSLSTH